MSFFCLLKPKRTLVLGATLLAVSSAAQPAFTPPAPPNQPSPEVANTRYTTRLFGRTPAEVAVSVTRHAFTATLPADDPRQQNAAADRPWSVVLVTPDDPAAAISAAELIQFPNNAPILFVDETGIPEVTRQELERLGPIGVQRADGVQAFVIGAAASPAVLAELRALGLKTRSITAPSTYALANQIDALYGQIQFPDSGVPTMMDNAGDGGNGVMNVFVGNVQTPEFMLPAAAWLSHLPAGVVWASGRDTLPAASVAALERRGGNATIYVMGGPEQISRTLFKKLTQYGAVARVTTDDATASNAPLHPNPVTLSVAFARMWDPVGLMGWNMVGSGHGFTVVNSNDWQSVLGAAILSSRGFHAALLLTDTAESVAEPVMEYLLAVRPTFLTTPAEGPYNQLYVVGDYSSISWQAQVEMSMSQEMTNRRNAPSGSTYLLPR